MLFKVTNKPLFQDNPELLSIEEFEECSEKQLRYVFLAYDYDSPFRKLPLDQRKERAALTAGYHTATDKNRISAEGRNLISNGLPNVVRAIKYFNSIQFDIDKEMLNAYDSQVMEFIETLRKTGKNPQEQEQALKIMNQLPKIKAERKKLIEEVRMKDTKEDDEIIKTEDQSVGPVSTIDEVNMEGEF